MFKRSVHRVIIGQYFYSYISLDIVCYAVTVLCLFLEMACGSL